ncbi:hypothetical protein V1515DRAFT_592580 [Lipomyces mesembrius]
MFVEYKSGYIVADSTNITTSRAPLWLTRFLLTLSHLIMLIRSHFLSTAHLHGSIITEPFCIYSLVTRFVLVCLFLLVHK